MPVRYRTSIQTRTHNGEVEDQPRPAKRRVWLWIVGVVVALLGGTGIWLGPAALDLYRAGFLDSTQQRQYEGTSLDNLRAIHTALMLYHESEGQFPQASGWMDAAFPRLKTADLLEEEARKKLRNPLLPPSPDVYGYAFNVAASGKFKDDIQNPSATPLVFDSSNTAWNASGEPTRLSPKPPRPGGNLAITVDGTLLRDGKPVSDRAPR